MSDESFPVFAGAVVVASDGRILCQLRDDKPGIICPGCWSSTPGGHVEPDEHPRDAIVRELLEEFEARVTNLNELITITETEQGIRGVYHAFSADLDMPIGDVRCHEGQRVEFFVPEEAMKLRQHPVSFKILIEFLNQENRARQGIS
jgi:8-oxo-dGTP diphosphatase